MIGLNLLVKLAVTLIAVLLGTALLQTVVAETPDLAAGLFGLLLFLSPVAYFLREASRKKPIRNSARRARERARVAAMGAEAG